MSDEVIWTYASQVTLEASGASAASNVFQPANDDTLESGVHLNFPLCDFALNCQFGAGVAAGSVVKLYRQDLAIQAANNSPAPGTTYKHLFVGSFVIPTGGSGSAWYPLTDVSLVKDQQYSIENATDQNLVGNWKLYATPKTYEPAA